MLWEFVEICGYSLGNFGGPNTLAPCGSPGPLSELPSNNIADCHSRSEKLVICSMSDLAAAAAAAGCSEAAAAMAAAATAPGRDAMQCDGVTGKLGAQITF
jgi:hypothetical protein